LYGGLPDLHQFGVEKASVAVFRSGEIDFIQHGRASGGHEERVSLFFGT
jgi:hypothetical protein